MALDPGSVGAHSAPHVHRYGWRDLALYALGIGARRDELAFLYEGATGGIQAYPSYAVVPAYPAVRELLERARVDFGQLLHGSQRIEAHGRLPAAGELTTVATLRGIYDLKRLTQLDVSTRTTLGGEPLVDTHWSLLVRGGGIGTRRPSDERPAPKAPRAQAPTWIITERTSTEQALLYRLSGDVNPLHADPEVARAAGFADGPILQGLCTFGFAARAVAQAALGGDPMRLRVLSAQFRRPVWPGDELRTELWAVEAGTVCFRTLAEGREDPVLANGYAFMAAP